MIELLILSGKGGTGKTTIASSFIKLGGIRAYADCDVDAPNLHLVMPTTGEKSGSDFHGMKKATIDQDKCSACGKCFEVCRFEAVKKDEGLFFIDVLACEGCSLCSVICIEKAIEMKEFKAGELIFYRDNNYFSTARLAMGNGTTGLLVTDVKKQLRNITEEIPITVIDGSPGIGCPVIASISGVDLVLIVAEPSLSGFSDMVRIIETSKIFAVKLTVCINKYNTNEALSKKIEQYCMEENILLIGKIPFDARVIEAGNAEKTPVDIDSIAGDAIKEIFSKILREIENI